VVGLTGRIFLDNFGKYEKQSGGKTSIRSSKKNEWETNILSEKRAEGR
jgi:hypothetical protein